jgi:hypothetical protein
MEKNKEDIQGGFDLLSNALMVPGSMDAIINEVDPDDVVQTLDTKTSKIGSEPNDDFDDLPDNIKAALDDKPIKKSIEGAKDFGDKTDIGKIDDDIEDTDLDIDKNVSELGEYESDVATFFADKFAEELNWELSEDEKPKDIKSVVDLIKKVVEENSAPVYSDDRVKNLDEFVKAGGKFEDYYSTVYQNRVSLEDIDIDNTNHQKSILKEHLQNSGYKDSAIEKKLQRWEDAGVLQDEAEEALDSVREYRAELEQKLLDDQKTAATASKQAQQKFFTNVDKTIKDLNTIRGVDFGEKKKKELLEYIFKPESDGLTKFYKDSGMIITHNTNVKSLLESAYFTKEGDTLVKAIERKVESKAAKNLKEKLATSKTGVRGYNQGQNERSGRYNLFSEVSRDLLPRG